jgi:hypothetical protein
MPDATPDDSAAKTVDVDLPKEQLLGVTAETVTTVAGLVDTVRALTALLKPIVSTSTADKTTVDKLVQALADLAAENAILKQYAPPVTDVDNYVTICFGPKAAYRLSIPVLPEEKDALAVQFAQIAKTLQDQTPPSVPK